MTDIRDDVVKEAAFTLYQIRRTRSKDNLTPNWREVPDTDKNILREEAKALISIPQIDRGLELYEQEVKLIKRVLLAHEEIYHER